MKLQSSNWAALSCCAPWAGCGSPFSHLPAPCAALGLTSCSWESLGPFWFLDAEKCYLKALLRRNSLPKLACQQKTESPNPLHFGHSDGLGWSRAHLGEPVVRSSPITVTHLPSFELRLGSDGADPGIKQHLGRQWITFRAGGVALEALAI